MKLVLKRITTVLYQSDSILELELDPLSTSGVDYWSQEARIAKLSLVYSTSLKNILEGSLREVKAGFHTFIALIYHGSTLIFAGVIADGAYQVEYHTPSQKTIALEITCFMGLLLTLAEDRPFTLSQSSLNPVLTIPSLIGAVLFPASSEPDYVSNGLYQIESSFYDSSNNYIIGFTKNVMIMKADLTNLPCQGSDVSGYKIPLQKFFQFGKTLVIRDEMGNDHSTYTMNGEFTIVVRKAGYQGQSRQVSITDYNRNHVFDFVLEPERGR